MHTDRGFDRLTFFSDAVVAIAMTLLVLPLTDIPGHAPKGQSIGRILGDHTFEIFAFVLSFVVIGVLWRVHHSIFEHLEGYNTWILQINQLWLFTIVVLPFTTELLNRSHDSRLADGLYVGTLVVSTASLSTIGLIARRHPELRHPDSPLGSDNTFDAGPWITPALMTIAFVVAVAVPTVGLWSLLLLLLETPIRLIADRRSATAT